MTLIVSAISLKMVDNGKTEKALLVNSIGSKVVVGIYVVANIIFISMALT